MTKDDPIFIQKADTIYDYEVYADDFELRWAKVWAVEPVRGDLYVVSVANGSNQFVQVSSGIVNKPSDVKNTPMQVLCDYRGRVIALPAENSNRFIGCKEVESPPDHVFVSV